MKLVVEGFTEILVGHIGPVAQLRLHLHFPGGRNRVPNVVLPVTPAVLVGHSSSALCSRLDMRGRGIFRE